MRACHIFCHTHIDCLRRFFHARVEHRHLLTICAAIVLSGGCAHHMCFKNAFLLPSAEAARRKPY